jgi:hypothetical protein
MILANCSCEEMDFFEESVVKKLLTIFVFWVDFSKGILPRA